MCTILRRPCASQKRFVDLFTAQKIPVWRTIQSSSRSDLLKRGKPEPQVFQAQHELNFFSQNLGTPYIIQHSCNNSILLHSLCCCARASISCTGIYAVQLPSQTPTHTHVDGFSLPRDNNVDSGVHMASMACRVPKRTLGMSHWVATTPTWNSCCTASPSARAGSHDGSSSHY